MQFCDRAEKEITEATRIRFEMAQQMLDNQMINVFMALDLIRSANQNANDPVHLYMECGELIRHLEQDCLTVRTNGKWLQLEKIESAEFKPNDIDVKPVESRLSKVRSELGEHLEPEEFPEVKKTLLNSVVDAVDTLSNILNDHRSHFEAERQRYRHGKWAAFFAKARSE